MATTSAGIPVEEYLRTYYDPDMEYVDGQLVERHVGEIRHSRLQTLIVLLLGGREDERGFRAYTELRIQISNDPPRYRIPDICLKALPHEMTPVLVGPDLVIEILSPDDEPGDLLAKLADYVGAGIPYIWIVDPYKRTVAALENGMHRKIAGLVLETPLVGTVDFAELFRKLDQ